MLGDLLERLFEGSPSLLVTSLVEKHCVTEKELHEIQRLIKEKGTAE
jgi:predicted transcriptional regulator